MCIFTNKNTASILWTVIIFLCKTFVGIIIFLNIYFENYLIKVFVLYKFVFFSLQLIVLIQERKSSLMN